MARRNVSLRWQGYAISVRRDSTWQEWRVTIRQGRAVLMQYHTDDYRDARNTAAYEIKRLRRRDRDIDRRRFECACLTCIGGQLCRAMCADCADSRTTGNGVVCHAHAVG